MGKRCKSKDNPNDILVSFVDSVSSEDVTGSMIYVRTPNHEILLDTGLHQSNDRSLDMKTNNRKFKGFNAKNIDLIFISHENIDHFALNPLLYKRGCRGITYIAEKSFGIYSKMLKDCTHINNRDALILETNPLYDDDDTDLALSYTKEIKTGQIVKIDDELSVKFVDAGHILCSNQIILYITVNGRTKKLAYGGDLGNPTIGNRFVGTFTPITEYIDMYIGEGTYGDKPNQKNTPKERRNDLDKIRTIVDTQIIQMKGKVICPVFAQSRCQTMLFYLYQLYKDNKKFKYKVYVDSPLSISIFDEYANILEGQDKKDFDEMLQWENLVFVKEAEDSKALVSSNEPCWVFASSGMCVSGRIRHHIKANISNPNATILMCGYTVEGSLGALLKDADRKTITIDMKEYPIRCACYSLKSMSCHMDFRCLVDYYTSLNTSRVIIHHASKEAKETLSNKLKEEFAKQCRTVNVRCSNSSMKTYL